WLAWPLRGPTTPTTIADKHTLAPEMLWPPLKCYGRGIRACAPPSAQQAGQNHQANSPHFKNPVPAETENSLANEAIHVVEGCRADQNVTQNKRRAGQSKPGGNWSSARPDQQSDCSDYACHRDQSDES